MCVALGVSHKGKDKSRHRFGGRFHFSSLLPLGGDFENGGQPFVAAPQPALAAGHDQCGAPQPHLGGRVGCVPQRHDFPFVLGQRIGLPGTLAGLTLGGVVGLATSTAATAARVRVTIEFAVRDDDHADRRFATCGVDENIVDASWEAITDAYQYFLVDTQ